MNNITYKPIGNEFQRDGFQFDLVTRNGDFAIFHKYSIVGPRHPKEFDAGFETVIITRHDGYEMGGVKIEPAEVYPSNEKWGVTGWTYKELLGAKKRFNSLLGKNTVQPTEENTEETDTVQESSNQPETPKRGRPTTKVLPTMIIPIEEFTCKQLAEKNQVAYIDASNFIRENLGKTLVLTKTAKIENQRGKPSNFYKKI